MPKNPLHAKKDYSLLNDALDDAFKQLKRNEDSMTKDQFMILLARYHESRQARCDQLKQLLAERGIRVVYGGINAVAQNLNPLEVLLEIVDELETYQ